MKKYNSVLIFDFETTGLDFKKDRVIELGALHLFHDEKDQKVGKRIDLLVNQHRILPKEIVELTHITNEMLERDGVLEEELFKTLNDIIKPDTLLVAYNIHFDISFMTNMFRRYLNNPNFEFANDILDVMAIYKDRAQDRFKNKLEAAIEQYNVKIPNSHRASDDSFATYYVLVEMIKELDNIDQYVNVLGYNPNYPFVGDKISHVKYVKQGYEKSTRKIYKIVE